MWDDITGTAPFSTPYTVNSVIHIDLTEKMIILIDGNPDAVFFFALNMTALGFLFFVPHSGLVPKLSFFMQLVVW